MFTIYPTRFMGNLGVDLDNPPPPKLCAGLGGSSIVRGATSKDRGPDTCSSMAVAAHGCFEPRSDAARPVHTFPGPGTVI